MWKFVEIPFLDDDEIIDVKDASFKNYKFKSYIKSASLDMDEAVKKGIATSGMSINYVDSYLKDTISSSRWIHTKRSFFSEEGVDVEILKFNSPRWQKGRIRMKLVVEFIPDELEEVEPESPLDDIRQAQLAKSED